MNDIKTHPLPTSGAVIVSVTTQGDRPHPVAFTDFVYCDPLCPMGRDGDPYMYRDEITHWMPKPDPVLVHEMDNCTTTRLHFFIDHVGKPIFRTRNGCSCELCERTYENGLIVQDKVHASSLASIETLTNIRYYATIEERNDSETTLPDNQTNETP